jgi:hypothetical protein
MSVIAANYAVRICRLQDVAAKMVLTALAWQARKETPHLAHMSNEDIRSSTGLKSVNGVKDALRRLVSAGEVRVLHIGGRTYGIGRAADFELLGVRRWIEAGKPSQSDGLEGEELSEFDGKVSAFDGKPSDSDGKLSASDTHRHRHSKTIRRSAAALTPATSSPSHPPKKDEAATGAPESKPRKAKVEGIESWSADRPLPHSVGFRQWWGEFVEFRRGKIKGRHHPLTDQAARIILSELAAVNEWQAVEAIKTAIASGYIKPWVDKFRGKNGAAPVAPAPQRSGPSALERSLERARMEVAA